MKNSKLKGLTTLKESLKSEIRFMKTFNPYSPKLNQVKQLYKKVCDEINVILHPTPFNICVQPGKMTVNF